MKILIMHRVPYRKVEYHRGIDHDLHEVTYVGARKVLAEIPEGLRCVKLEIPGAGEAAAEVLARIDRAAGFEAVISLSEFELLEAAKVREALGVPGARPGDALKVRDKLVMKELVAAKGLRVPRNCSAAEFAARTPAPGGGAMVIKPTQGASSEGVEVLRDAQAALERLLAMAAAGADLGRFEVEEFVDGAVHHVDGVSRGGEVLALVVSRYVGTCLEYLSGAPLGSHQTGHSEELESWVCRGLEAVGITDGAFHLEFIEDAAGPVFLEVANRVGGADVIRSFEARTGIHIPSAELQILMAQAAGGRGRVPAMDGHRAAPELYGWFVFPGHQHAKRAVRTRVPAWIQEHPGISLKTLPDGSPHPDHVTYQDWEVPVAGFVKGRSAGDVRGLIESCVREITVEGIS
jgi:hypothetical protein